MTRKDQAFNEARSSTIPLDNPAELAHHANDGGQPELNQDWRPPKALETPPPRPGYINSWIRTSIGGVDDADNIRKKMAEGWVPVLAKAVSQDFFAPTIMDKRFAAGQAIVGIRDMVLMEMPLRMKKQRDAHYAARAQTQVRQIDIAMHKESQRAGDKFFAIRDSRSELRSAPLDDEQ